MVLIFLKSGNGCMARPSCGFVVRLQKIFEQFEPEMMALDAVARLVDFE